MKVIIAGSNSISDENLLLQAIEKSSFKITELVCGMANNVDRMAYRWAKRKKIPIKEFWPQWKKYGKKAGPIRNKAMTQYADALIAIWRTGSQGTWNMIRNAFNTRIDFYILRVKNEQNKN